MNWENLWEEVMKSALEDPEYLWYQNLVQDAERAYLEVSEFLSPEQKLAVEEYIAAIEHLGDRMMVLAYGLGKNDQ